VFDSKNILLSKTAWFNILGTVATILTTTSQVMPPEWGVVAMGIGNLLLRYFTTKPVTILPQ